jgi:hypothetical protein
MEIGNFVQSQTQGNCSVILNSGETINIKIGNHGANGCNWWKAKPFTDDGVKACQRLGDVYLQKALIDGFVVEAKVTLGFPNPRQLTEHDIRAFGSLPEFPIKQREDIWEGIAPVAIPLEGEITAVVNYGDPLKLGGYSESVSGTKNEIRARAKELIDQMWQDMNRNGEPYCNIVVGEYKFTRNWGLIPPSRVTGLWLCQHAALILGLYFNNIALKLFKGRPSASSIKRISRELVLQYVDDHETYSTSLSTDEEKELCNRHLKWVRFEVA